MPTTYEPIATTTVTSSTATVSFTSIPATYTDLVLVVANLLQVSGGNGLRGRFNSDTGTNYSDTTLRGNGTSAVSDRESNQSSFYVGETTYSSSEIGMAICHIMNYSNTTTYKTALSRSGRAGSDTIATVNLWRSTSAINRIDIALGGAFPTNNISTGTFTLYGIKAA
jgi:hypothetical protein